MPETIVQESIGEEALELVKAAGLRLEALADSAMGPVGRAEMARVAVRYVRQLEQLHANLGKKDDAVESVIVDARALLTGITGAYALEVGDLGGEMALPENVVVEAMIGLAYDVRDLTEEAEATSPCQPAAARILHAADRLQAGRYELRARTRALLSLTIAMDEDPGLTVGVSKEADAGSLAAERKAAMRDLSTEAGAIADAITALASEHPELRVIGEDVPEYLKSAAALAEAALDQSLATPMHRPRRLHFVEAAIRENLEAAWGAANFDGRRWTGDDA